MKYEYKTHTAYRGYGWIEPLTDSEDSLIEGYLARRICEELNALQAERDALNAENERLRCIISDLKDWDCDVSGGFLSIPVDLRRRIQNALAAYRKQEGRGDE